jgi:hypothetical protein
MMPHRKLNVDATIPISFNKPIVVIMMLLV